MMVDAADRATQLKWNTTAKAAVCGESFDYAEEPCRTMNGFNVLRQAQDEWIFSIVPTLRLGNAACDAPASRNARALQDEFPCWRVETIKIGR